MEVFGSTDVKSFGRNTGKSRHAARMAIAISNAIFNDPELQKMGLEAAPEEELEQTETDTGDGE